MKMVKKRKMCEGRRKSPGNRWTLQKSRGKGLSGDGDRRVEEKEEEE